MIHFLDPLEKSGYRKEHKNWLKENLKLKVGRNFFSLSPIKNSDDNSNI
jgi:hypothetical protein